jgi:hypothetical protein
MKWETQSQVPPKNHQYRIGRVQRGILRAFIVAPEWTTRELMEWTHSLALYRGGRSHRERHYYCRDIRRAADRIAARVGRRWPDGIVWRARE